MNNIEKAIKALSDITSKDLDEAGIQNLCQLYYWISKHEGAIYVKTIGKLDLITQAHLSSKREPV